MSGRAPCSGDAVRVSPAPRAGRALTPQVWKPRLTALAWSSRSLCWPLRGHGPDANLPAQAHWPEGRLTAAQPCCPRGWGEEGETAAGGTRSPVPGCAFPSPQAHGGHRRGKVRVTVGHGASWGLILRPLCRIQGRSSLLQNSNSPQPYNMQNESKVITHQHLTIHL